MGEVGSRADLKSEQLWKGSKDPQAGPSANTQLSPACSAVHGCQRSVPLHGKVPAEAARVAQGCHLTIGEAEARRP